MQKNITTEQLQKNFQTTLSRISHEIRNPLTLINCELKYMAYLHPEVTYYEEWADILDNLDYIQKLLDDLSDYNNANKLTIVSIDTSVFLHTILNSLKPSMKYLGISLVWDIPSDLPHIQGDTVRLRQAILNLLRNAQEAVSPENGVIAVKAAMKQNNICITINDNGCGIPSDKLDLIFDLFYTSKQTGTGLGLTITRQIIEAHHGSLKVESVPNQGSSFQIVIKSSETWSSSENQHD